MVDDLEYGKNQKRIVFTDTDHRHAQLIVKLKTDGMTQANFFRSLISGYINGDERIENFILENGKHSVKKKQQVEKIRKTGRTKMSELGLDDEQVDNLFDLIAEEFPEL
jgi:hypothetical protein|tara:strand:+ start:150 stop:476 length:327 start_codon:yes stop_codon:yes gene_type:complete